MKKLYFLLFIIPLVLLACKKDALDTKFGSSYSAWRTFRNKNNNSYVYTSYNGSVFGYYSETKFTIKNGKIIGREFTSGRYKENTDSLITNASWTENEATLNTHPDAAELLTLDQVYTKAQNTWLKADTKANDVYFDVDARGLIASAGYVPKGCQDDCFTGVNIRDIAAF